MMGGSQWFSQVCLHYASSDWSFPERQQLSPCVRSHISSVSSLICPIIKQLITKDGNTCSHYFTSSGVSHMQQCHDQYSFLFWLIKTKVISCRLLLKAHSIDDSAVFHFWSISSGERPPSFISFIHLSCYDQCSTCSTLVSYDMENSSMMVSHSDCSSWVENRTVSDLKWTTFRKTVVHCSCSCMPNKSTWFAALGHIYKDDCQVQAALNKQYKFRETESHINIS